MKPSNINPTVVSGDKQYISNLFHSLDSNNDGKITKEELKEGFLKLKIPATDQSINDFLQEVDTNHDGNVSIEEFSNYINHNIESLQKLFNEFDTDHNGTLDIQEIEKSIHKLGIKIYSEQELVRLFNRIDTNKDKKVDFDEWRELLVLLPTTKLSAALAFWKDSQILDGGDDGGGFAPPPPSFSTIPAQSLSEATQIAIKNTLSFMGAGAAAGVISRTATAPIERVKLTYQLNHGAPRSIAETFRIVYADGGFRGLFRGNFANILKVSPESAVKFASFEAVKRLFAETDAELTSAQRFISGASAGVVSHTTLFPMEVVRTRLSAEPVGTYTGIFDCFRQTYRTDGFRAFYRGLGASILSTIPHSGINMLVYETLKHEIIKRSPAEIATPSQLLLCASISSTMGQVVSYPIHVIKTRLVTGGTVANPERYSGLIDGLQKTVKKEGFLGLYRGIIPNFMKSIPSHGITFVTYEFLKTQFGISKKEKHGH
ncbi:EF-hand domain-containing protein [Heterostelium album PN500]|uniref:EF-hand domain-containing protein n=1 Tax=Heterostelium pallidum (strain ATCC 26659 / Pp 5 / PN500) TaxID=670386 RepID=D3BR25_HETP5|nr:EF-hand domain-containing protein [Heterostelium album PN500]EFA75857.1 EF-hand domain-containing protein [Heterostelium album PN500]|eukprot:XP_020427991.1 EF-hand domain-containing protein [Heterostelium album PN500]